VPTVFNVPVIAEGYTQNAGVSLTLSGSSLNGVAITANSASLAGELVINLDGINVYDGMTFTLVNATSITGQWQNVQAVTSSSECYSYQSNTKRLALCVFAFSLAPVDVKYTQTLVTATVDVQSLCGAALFRMMFLFF
jgi:hypothetical protein